MRLGTKIAMGVDISEKLISMALLKSNGDSIQLLKTVSSPVPDGAIKNGNIEDPNALAAAIKKLKKRITIRSTPAVVSLFIKPVIVQTIDIPKQIPGNIRQFVKSQMKHYAALPGRKMALDYCGTSAVSSETGNASRLLAVATDAKKVAEFAKLCSKAGITVEAIEPPLLAYTRSYYTKKIAGKFDNNVLLAILRENTLTLGVFRKQALEFVRTNNLSEEKIAPNELCSLLAEQINAVIQFYDVEVPGSTGKWEITVVADSVKLPENSEDSLKGKVAGVDLELLSNEDICQSTVVTKSGRFTNVCSNDKPSPAVIGLAMKLLDKNNNLGVNLLPPELIKLHTIQKEILVAVNILAVILLIMILAVNGPFWKIKNLNESTGRKKKNISRNTDSLVAEQIWMDEQISTIKQKINKINKIIDAHSNTDWPRLLNDIAKSTPKTVCITNMSSKTSSGMSLQGLALSNEDVYLFVDTLNKSKYIDSASIVETEKDLRQNGFINYEISCSLPARKEL